MAVDFDVVVVGARCAGSPTAMRLANMGHKVLLLDRADFPSGTHSTHYIHQAGIIQLAEWGLLDEIRSCGAPEIKRMEYRNEGMNLYGWADPVAGIGSIYNPRRVVLDEILVKAAVAAGVELITGFTVTGLLPSEDGGVGGVEGTFTDGTTKSFTARMVVGADGTYSAVARLVGAEKYNVRPAAGFTYWNYFHGLDWEMSQHKTGMNRRWYGAWPTNDGTSVAVILTNDQHDEFRKDPEENFLKIIEEIEPEKGKQIREVGVPEGRMHRMKYAENFYRESSGHGWALVGDAGYHKDPITGWGMTDAFLQAEGLASAVHAGLSGEASMKDATDQFVASRDEMTEPMYDYTTTVAQMDLPLYFRSIIKACSRSQEWTNKMLGVVAGIVDGGEVFEPENLSRLYAEADLPQEERILDPMAG